MVPSSTSRKFSVNLIISSEELLKLYSGQARDVVAQSTCGQRVRFPAGALKPYVTHNGVHGLFTLTVNDANKLINLRREGPAT